MRKSFLKVVCTSHQVRYFFTAEIMFGKYKFDREININKIEKRYHHDGEQRISFYEKLHIIANAVSKKKML